MKSMIEIKKAEKSRFGKFFRTKKPTNLNFFFEEVKYFDDFELVNFHESKKKPLIEEPTATELVETENIDSKVEMMQEVPINTLPLEILCEIFSRLEFTERKNASLVCKKWRSVFLDPIFLNHIVIKANNQLFLNRPQSATKPRLTTSAHRSHMSLVAHSSSHHQQLPINLYLYHNAVSLEFENDSADAAFFLSYLKSLCGEDEPLLPRLKSLKFVKNTLSSKSLIELLNAAPNLVNLEIINCDSLFMTGFLSCKNQISRLKLERLETLSLSNNRYLTDFLLNWFIDLAPNLKSLDISFICMTKTKFKSIGNNEAVISTANGVSNVILTIENFEKVSERLKRVEAIDLSGIELFGHDATLLLSLVEKMPCLNRIGLANLPTLKAETLVRIIEKAPLLHSLDLAASVQLEDAAQKGIESMLESLLPLDSVLKMSKAKISNPIALANSIGHYSSLTWLDLSHASFQRSFPSPARLNNFIEQFANSLSQCVHLEALLLSYCDFLVTDTLIKTIACKLSKLRILDLRNCSQITDSSLHYIAHFLERLETLDISWCQNISDNGLDFTIELEQDARFFNELNKRWNNTACRCMRKFIEQPFLLLKMRAEIKSEFCTCSTAAPSTQITHMELQLDKENFTLKNLKSLKKLRMESCVNVSDAGLERGVNLAQLEELDIKLCTNVNGDFIAKSGKSLNNLKVLNLNQCVKFKEENLLWLVERAVNLRELSVSSLQSASDQLVLKLLEKKRLLHLFDISFCANIHEATVEPFELLLYNEFGSHEFNLDKRFISR